VIFLPQLWKGYRQKPTITLDLNLGIHDMRDNTHYKIFCHLWQHNGNCLPKIT